MASSALLPSRGRALRSECQTLSLGRSRSLQWTIITSLAPLLHSSRLRCAVLSGSGFDPAGA
eukprot:3749568-Rhodomonas_salina.1